MFESNIFMFVFVALCVAITFAPITCTSEPEQTTFDVPAAIGSVICEQVEKSKVIRLFPLSASPKLNHLYGLAAVPAPAQAAVAPHVPYIFIVFEL